MKKAYTALSIDFQPMNLDTTVTAACVHVLVQKSFNYPTPSDLDCAYLDYSEFTANGVCGKEMRDAGDPFPAGYTPSQLADPEFMATSGIFMS